MLIQLMMNLVKCLIMFFKMSKMSKIVINNRHSIYKMIYRMTYMMIYKIYKMNNKVIFNKMIINNKMNKMIYKRIIKKYNNKLKHNKINKIKIIMLICNVNQCIKYQNK